MELLIQIVLLAVGLVLVVKGADFLVEGATDVARRFNVSEFVIGLTIVGFGTSCPELVVSVTGAVKGLSDVAAGNVVGSNIFNILLILGITPVITPVPILRENRRFDLPILIGVTVLLIALTAGDTIAGMSDRPVLGRWDGGLLLVIFVVYIIMCFKLGKSDGQPSGQAVATGHMWRSALYCVGGLAALVFGGRLFVDSATELARAAGLSEKFIAITILAVGTSLPELITSIVAARKNKIQLALGNIIGSCVFNILFILGCSALIHPVSMENIDIVDLVTLLGAPLLILLSCYTGRDNKVSRTDGVMMLVVLAAYMAWLIYKANG